MATSCGVYTPIHGKKCRFYVNGNPNFLGKVCVINPKRTRNMDALLTEVNDRIKGPRAFTRLFTPRGSHKILDPEQLEDKGNYVAVANERFKRMGYLELEQAQAQYKRGPLSPRNYNVKPVEHSRKWMSSGRIKKIPTEVVTIFVYRNAQDLVPPARITITHQMVRYGWDCVFDEIKSRLRSSMNGAPKRLCTLEGRRIDEVKDLANMENYVLVCNGDIKGFKKANYGRTQPPFQSSPRMSRKTNNYHGVVENRPRPSRAAKKEEDQVFHVKPVKLKRTPETTRQVDLDKDEGGIFKAKQKNNATAGAEEIEESKDTKVDLPIDQVEAEEVTEEEIEESNKTYRKKKPIPTPKKTSPTRVEKSPSITPRSPTPRVVSPEKKVNHKEEEAATKIQSGARGYLARKETKKLMEEKKIKDEEATRAVDESLKQYQDSKQEKEKEAKAALKLQAWYRAYKLRMEILKELQAQDTNRQEAAKCIQAGYRGSKARGEFRQMKNERYNAQKQTEKNQQKEAKEKERKALEKKTAAATTLQSGYRGYNDRRRVKQLREIKAGEEHTKKKILENEEKETAATKIQAGYKGYADRQKVRKMREQKKELEEKETAATTIQAGYKGYADRQKVRKMREQKKELEVDAKQENEERDKAATTVQAGYRGYKDRQKVKVMKEKPLEEKNEEREKAATTVQAGYRGYKDRQKVKVMKEKPVEEKNKEKDKAATTIQAGYKGYKDRQKVKVMKEKAVEEKCKFKAVLRVQAGIRGYQVRKTMKPLLEERKRERCEKRREKAVVRIQAGFRGYRDRRIVFDKRVKKGIEDIKIEGAD